MIEKDMYKELEDALGSENLSQEPGIMDGYAWQPALGLNKTKWIDRPEAVVLPQSTEEVQKVVKICNKYKMKFKAFSTGWAAWGGPGSPGVIQIDLRRMNRILEIDEKNMYAVIEPYVIGAQLQAEVMKHGLNCHIIGAGPNTSPLASITSVCGYGWTGLLTGHSSRNPLSMEWVTPDGEILKLGSLESNNEWFSGDGPGPSIRGITRGWAGALGGLGVFTKCAAKLYHWPGPRQPKIEGILVDVKAEVPKLHKTYFIFSPSYERYADLAYKIGNSEIGYIHCKGAFGAQFGINVPRIRDKILGSAKLRKVLQAWKHLTLFMFTANTERELAYQEKVVKQIVADTESIILDMDNIPDNGMFWWTLHRSILPALAFKPGGDFLTSFGSCVEYDNAVYQAKIAEELKQKYIDKGIFLEDLADCTWGGIYEGTSNWGHMEEIGMFDPRKPEAVEGRFEYMDETNELCVKKHLGYSILAMGPAGAKIYSPHMNNYEIWQAKIKKAFDPNNSADGSFYVEPYKE